MGICLLQSYLLGHLPPPDVLGLVVSSESRSSTVLPCTACVDVDMDAGGGSSVCVAVTRDTSDGGSGADGDVDPALMMKGMLARVSQSCLLLLLLLLLPRPR